MRINDSTRGNFLLEFQGNIDLSTALYYSSQYNGALDRSPRKLPANDSRIHALYPCKRVSKHERHGQRVHERDTTSEVRCSRVKIITAATSG